MIMKAVMINNFENDMKLFPKVPKILLERKMNLSAINKTINNKL